MSIFGTARQEMTIFDGKVSAKTAKQLEEVGSDLLEALILAQEWIAAGTVAGREVEETSILETIRPAIAKAKGEA